MAKQKAALGRGLGAILGEVEESYQNEMNDNSGLVVEIEIDKIAPNPFQPRKYFDENALNELADSIKEHGLLQPILVYENTDPNDSAEYFVIAGERRLRASKIAQKSTIKAIIVDINTAKLRELALIENIQREELNPIDLAHAYRELIDEHGITHEEVAFRLSKSRAQITNTLRLLDLCDFVQQMIMDGRISQGHAKMLVTLESNTQKMVADSIIGQKLSVAQTEELVRRLKSGENINAQNKKEELQKLANSTKSAKERKKGNKKSQEEFDSEAENAIVLSKEARNRLEEICEIFSKNNINANTQNSRLIVDFGDERDIERFCKFLKKYNFK